MKDRLVNTCITILRTLPRNGTNVNNVIKQTSLPLRSPDRTHIEEAIKTLKQGQLILKDKDPAHKQKLIVKLTQLGQEFKEIVDIINQYNESYSKFKKAVKENIEGIEEKNDKSTSDTLIPTSDGKLISNIEFNVDKARHRGWTDEEIYLSGSCISGISWVEHICQTHIFDALIFRYGLTLYKFSVNNIAKEILVKVIINEITHQLLVIQKKIDNHNFILTQDRNFDADRIFNDLAAQVQENIDDVYSDDLYLPSFHFINKEIKNLLISMFSIIKPLKMVMEVQIKNLELQIESLEKEKRPIKKKIPTKRMLELRDLKELRDIYQEVMNKSST